MELPLPIDSLVVAAIIMCLASVVQCTLGMGGAIIAAPLMAWLFPEFLPAPLIINGALMTALVALREWRQVVWSSMRLILPSSLAGIVAGSILLRFLTTDSYAVFVGGAILVAVGLVAGGWSFARNTSNSVIAGTACGFMHATVSLPGPPIMLLFRREPIEVFRPTLAAYFLITSLLSLLTLFVVDRLGGQELLLAGTILPGTLVGFLLSNLLLGRIPMGRLHHAVLVFAALSACGLLVRGLV